MWFVGLKKLCREYNEPWFLVIFPVDDASFDSRATIIEHDDHIAKGSLFG